MQNKNLEVIFKCECDLFLKEKISEVLALDPRPRYHQDGQKIYGSKLETFDIHWEVIAGVVHFLDII